MPVHGALFLITILVPHLHHVAFTKPTPFDCPRSLTQSSPNYHHPCPILGHFETILIEIITTQRLCFLRITLLHKLPKLPDLIFPVTPNHTWDDWMQIWEFTPDGESLQYFSPPSRETTRNVDFMWNIVSCDSIGKLAPNWSNNVIKSLLLKPIIWINIP